MHMLSKRGWVIAIAAVLAATAIGVTVALLIFPSDQPKPAASPAIATIKIAPSSLPEPIALAPPVVVPAPTRVTAPRHRTPHPAPTVSPDPDPATVTTTNSW
jgi:hypothetical protein